MVDTREAEQGHAHAQAEAARHAALRFAAGCAQLLPSQLPVELLPLSWMLGAWRGHGKGGYPGMEDFAFIQEVAISTDGRPFLTYASHTWELTDEGRAGRPLATETGYIRPVASQAASAAPGGSTQQSGAEHAVEMVMCHPMGYAETWAGTTSATGVENAQITGARMMLASAGVLATATAKDYTSGSRMYGLVNGKLLWVFDMQAMGQPMASHVSAQLEPLAWSE